MSKVATIISAIIIVALIAALIAGLVLYINNGQSNFYVDVAGQSIATEAKNIELKKNAYNLFNVNSVFGNSVKGVPAGNYDVSVSLNTQNISDVAFSIEDKTYGLYDVDFSPAFAVSKKDGCFSIYVPDVGLAELLKKCYGQSVSLDETVDLWNSDCFVLNVSFPSEEKTVTISFH